MKQKLCLVGAIALLLGSCSEGLENPVENRNGKTIDFVVTHSGTRVAESTVMSEVGTFKLWGAQSGTIVNGLNGVVVSYNADDTKWTYEPAVAWPNTDPVNFYAYAPANAGNIASNADVTKVIYTVPAPADQEDFLIATKTASDDGVGTAVLLQFDHALARIEVKAKYAGTTAKNISAIKLLNLQNKGTIDLAKGHYAYADDGSSYNTWPIADGSAKTDYEVTLGTPVALSDGEYTDILTGANGLVVLPQATTLGGFNADKNNFDTDKEDAFYLVATIDGEDRYYKVADNYNETEEIGIVFEAGRKYTFRLDLGTEPQPQLGDVEFDAGVNGYVDGGNIDLTEDESITIP
jgi:hypothetical protein